MKDRKWLELFISVDRLGEIYLINAKFMLKYIETADRKSFSADFLRKMELYLRYIKGKEKNWI